MNREKIEQDIINIFNKQVFMPDLIAGLESFIADWHISELKKAEARGRLEAYRTIQFSARKIVGSGCGSIEIDFLERLIQQAQKELEG